MTVEFRENKFFEFRAGTIGDGVHVSVAGKKSKDATGSISIFELQPP
jgi:hypothetical protein